MYRCLPYAECPTPAPCLTHLQLLEQEIRKDTVAEPGHTVQGTGRCFPSGLTFGGSHPGEALCQSPVRISGANGQGAPTFSPTT